MAIRRSCARISVLIAALYCLHVGNLDAQTTGFSQTINQVQPRMVKITGSGGFAGLEPYQSGFVVSAEGHILTVWSYVLDSDVVTVTLNDGQKFTAKLLGYDPRIEIALLKIEANGLSHFNLDESVEARVSNRVLAFSNLYGVATGNEPFSVQHGIVSAKTDLAGRRGAFDSTYQGKILVVDAMTNNPGSAGGALTDRQGRLIGLIGKEIRDSQTNSWLNFAIPIDQIAGSVAAILSGKNVIRSNETARRPTEPISLQMLGIVLVPNVVSRTPPFVDRVIEGTSAYRIGLNADDLIIEINGQLTPTAKALEDRLTFIDRDAEIRIVVQRGKVFKSFDVRANQ